MRKSKGCETLRILAGKAYSAVFRASFAGTVIGHGLLFEGLLT